MCHRMAPLRPHRSAVRSPYYKEVVDDVCAVYFARRAMLSKCVFRRPLTVVTPKYLTEAGACMTELFIV